MCVVSRKNGFLALFFRIVAHSVDGSTTNSQKVTPGQKHICRVRNPGCHFRSAQPLDSQHQKTDFYTFRVCVCVHILVQCWRISDMASENSGYLSSEWPREQRGGHVDPRRQFFFLIYFPFHTTYLQIYKKEIVFAVVTLNCHSSTFLIRNISLKKLG